MCSFGSCKMRFEFLSQFRKVRNAFECFVTQVQTRLPKSKRVWPMKINVICTVHQKDYIEIRPETPGVWTKDFINFIPIYCHHWDCGLGQVHVRQARGYIRGCEMSW